MISRVIEQSLIEKVNQLIDNAQHVVIVSHENPDGDAVGSSLAMMHFLRAYGKEDVKVILPSELPYNLKWLPGVEELLIYSLQEKSCCRALQACDLILFLDLNALSRTGKMSQAFNGLSAQRVLIDHHEFPEPFAPATISCPQISSTSELVFRYISRSGCLNDLNQDAAVCIYTGMMTDTGCFSYNSNQPDIYVIVHYLLQKGVDKDAIYRKVFYAFSEDRMRMTGYLMYKAMEIMPEYQTAITSISKRRLKYFNYRPGDTENIVNMPLQIEGVNISIFLREDNPVRISFRSVGDIPVNRLANELFGGGGHKNAAGARYKGKLSEAVEMIKQAIPKFVESL
ncbi:MAG: bifunctional oligoribonuclease/PAP phosphatase NrnA [Bacteroidales bacterium]|nr:bifunctional oligoribonuclease/PAP phosphatase NrnA [Bacteroidales bacterium]